MNKIPFLEGATLIIDKPLNWSSFDVVKKIRSEIIHHFNLKKIKVGHAGTLDPLATGLMVVCTGEKTKTLNGNPIRHMELDLQTKRIIN